MVVRLTASLLSISLVGILPAAPTGTEPDAAKSKTTPDKLKDVSDPTIVIHNKLARHSNGPDYFLACGSYRSEKPEGLASGSNYATTEIETGVQQNGIVRSNSKVEAQVDLNGTPKHAQDVVAHMHCYVYANPAWPCHYSGGDSSSMKLPLSSLVGAPFYHNIVADEVPDYAHNPQKGPVLAVIEFQKNRQGGVSFNMRPLSSFKPQNLPTQSDDTPPVKISSSRDGYYEFTAKSCKSFGKDYEVSRGYSYQATRKILWTLRNIGVEVASSRKDVDFVVTHQPYSGN